MKCERDKKNGKSFRPEFGTGKECKRVSKFIGFYNAAASIVAVALFAMYIIYTVKHASSNSIDSFHKTAMETTRQINEYLNVQTENLEDFLYFIDDEELSIKKVIKEVSYNSFWDGKIMIVDPDTCVGNIVLAKNKDNLDAKCVEVDLSQNEVIRALCNDDELFEDIEMDDADFSISSVFDDPINQEKAFALYCPITCREEDYLFCCVMNTSLILDRIASNSILIDRGILIDAQCNLLAGDLRYDNQNNNISGDRLYIPESVQNIIDKHVAAGETETFLEILKDEDFEKQVEKGVSTEDSGIFTIKNHKNIDNIYIYLRIETLGDWYYISRISEGPLVNFRMIIALIMGTICFIGLPWCINVLVVFSQNKRLMRTLITLEENNKQLEAANKAQTAFISSMSHEIRTPINAVLGMDEIIIRETSEDNIREYAYDIRNAGKSLLGIVNDILDFTKIESGKMDIIEDEYEISSMINDLANMTRARLEGKNLDFRIELNPQIPHLLYGDEIRVKQIILNILTNAVKYTQEGGILFKVDYRKIDEEYIDLSVAVSDTGIGMKQEEMDRLFKPFERLDEKKNRTIEGTGLGMSIVIGLLSQMGSQIEVKSEYGKGSMFAFHLKQKVLDWTENGPYLERLTRVAGETKEDGALFTAHRAQILVVDDTVVNLTVAKGLLKRTAATVDVATSGQECLDMLEKKAYHVILLDHRMPEMDGVETLHRIRLSDNENSKTTVIALTANAVSGAKEYYLREGFNDYLTKPINGKKLEQMLLKYLPEEVIDTEDELAVMVDAESGMKNCGSEELYRQTVTEVVKNAGKISKEIQELLLAEDIRNYTIKVHTLKSTARLLGALALSEEALWLEQCGDAGDKKQIEEKTPALLNHFAIVVENLRHQYKMEDEEQDKPLMEPGELMEALQAILEFSAAFDFDQVDHILHTIESYTVPDNATETIEALKSAVYDINQEEIEQVIKNYLGGQNNE